MKRFVVAVVILLLAAASAGTSTASAQGAPGQFNPPKRYYLALGDSIAFGLQLYRVFPGIPASAFTTGYVDDFAAKLRNVRPGIETVNYGCPGETTTSFSSGGCLWTASGFPLHAPYQGSQLDAAVRFLRAHPGQVSPITLHLFGNDVSASLAAILAACGDDLGCIQQNAPAAISAFAGRLQGIVHALRREAPDAELLVTSGWNPLVDSIAVSDPFFHLLVSAMQVVATTERATFVDLLPLFNPNPPAARVAALCALTLCAYGDSHPSDTGYAAIAEAVWEASGYDRFRGNR
jgi:lysophospholipase L1-like esterase